MYACFRRDDAADAEVFMDAAIAILATYPDDVIIDVTDPRTGIPSQQKWPPQPFEVTEACKAANQKLHPPPGWADEWQARAKRQLEEREREEAARAERPTIADLKAKYGENWGIGTGREEIKTHDPERLKRLSHSAQREIENQYAAMGAEPVMCGKLIVSPSLVARVKGWQGDPETVAAEKRWKDDERSRRKQDTAA